MLASRRRSVAVIISVVVLVGAFLITQPRIGSYSSFEDPRPGGTALLPPPAPRGQPSAEPTDSGKDAAVEPDAARPGGLPAREPAGELDPLAAGGPIRYVVQPGDSLSTISMRYGVSVSDLWIANRLLNPHSLQPGQALLIPAGPEDVFGTSDPDEDGQDAARTAETVQHVVRNGENLWTIARKYGVSSSAISKANGLTAAGLIRPGDELRIPGAAGGAAGAASFALAWPVYGTISSPFGMRSDGKHEGLDISALRGTPVRAAASGRVIKAGAMGNYGQAIIIDHGNGFQTLYAHCDRLLAARGARVDGGDQIATVGNTGRSTGPHLHFEVIVNGVRRDPLRFLLIG
jgi:murein DD-endopeptidase MepM/ murein hydrolase activator NlpD